MKISRFTVVIYMYMYQEHHLTAYVSFEKRVEVIVPEEDAQLLVYDVLVELIESMVGQLTSSHLQELLS